jgi:hypothetical protein
MIQKPIDNDRFVAYNLLQNAAVVVEGAFLVKIQELQL